MPDIPDMPPMPDMPDMPPIPDIPDMPPIPPMPDIPDMPPMPDMPPIPPMPDMPLIPDMPPIPPMPDIPDMPPIPPMPDMPLIPPMPPMPDIPLIPASDAPDSATEPMNRAAVIALEIAVFAMVLASSNSVRLMAPRFLPFAKGGDHDNLTVKHSGFDRPTPSSTHAVTARGGSSTIAEGRTGR